MSNPFQPIPKEKKPKEEVTNYHKDIDDYIIEYGEIDHVKMIGKEDTDFVINKEVKEISRTNRQEYYDSFSTDVGILNIIKKVQLSGDVTLLNQTGRVPGYVVGKDALGHDVEEVVDVSKYQVDQIDALESYKVGAAAYNELDENLKKKLSFEQVAKLKDDEIDAYLESVKQALIAKNADNKESE